ncbi:MAG: hypothetical protein ACKV2T_06365 [Kofleriaceae bacterium]
MPVVRPILTFVSVFFVAACGDDAASLDADAASPDAAIDGSVVDAPDPPPMLVELPACAIVDSTSGVYVENAAQVIVHAADGTALCRNTPSVNGTPIAVPPGGAITIVQQGSARGLLTVLQPQPGDEINLAAEPSLMFDVALDFPALVGATSYRLTCPFVSHTGEVPGTARVPRSCLGADNLVHTIVVAYASNNAIVGYGKLALRPTNVTFGSQGTPITTPVWETALAPLTVTLANAPAGLQGTRICPGVIVDGVLNGWRSPCVPPGTAIPMPMIGDALVVQTMLNAQEEETWLDARRHPIGTQSVTLDVTTDALPRITTTFYGGTSARPSVGWTSSRTIDRGSHVVATATWRIMYPTHSHSTMWRLFAPIAATSPIVFPQLPLDLQPAGVLVEPELFLWDIDGANYDAVRAEPLRGQALPHFITPPVTATSPAPTAWSLSVRGDFD